VIWVNSSTLTATVPWGMDAGVYTLTVVNPDGGTGSLAGAFTVTQGLGQWNGGDLFGGDVHQILLKPGDPNTLYASVYEVGLFRSRDAGEHWSFISGFMNADYAIDPSHPDWLYIANKSLYRSQDEGDTWTKLVGAWPDGQSIDEVGHVYVSPHNPQVLFLSSSNNPGFPPDGAQGLIKSTDGGASWHIVADMTGIPVQDVDFHPTDPLQMVLGTQAGQVFHSSDGGDTWSEVLKPPISFVGTIAYNPYEPAEVWITFGDDTGIYKSTDAAFTGWQNVTPQGIGHKWFECCSFIKFTSAASVYTNRRHSTNGGIDWNEFAPVTSRGEVSFNPDNLQIGYIGDETYGVQKTMDGGLTWEIKNQGLTGMSASTVEASRADPLRVYATFGNWSGIYRSEDGANNWTYLPIDGSAYVRMVREDPFDPQHIYVTADSGFYVSTNRGENWSVLGCPAPRPGGGGCPYNIELDPYQPGHLLVGVGLSNGEHGEQPSLLYSSSDYGMTWTLINVTQDLSTIRNIIFHPETPGLVYLQSKTGLFRSTDSGNTWVRIDDLQKPDMLNTDYITIATHPQHILTVGWNNLFRSLDGGDTWTTSNLPPVGGVTAYMFLGGDSTRLYGGTWFGLFLSSNVGTSWQRAAGTLGQMHITAMDNAVGNDYTILYAATSGGTTGVTTSGTDADTSQEAVSAAGNLVQAGIYRYVNQQNTPGLPGVPALIAPANNALTTLYTPKLDWNDAANANHYQLQIATDNTFATTVVDKPSIVPSEFTPASDLTPNTKYYWRVRTYNSLGNVSAWSLVSTFRTALPAPVSLGAEGTIQNLRPKLTWDMPAYPLPAATGYTLQVSKNNTFTQVVYTGAATSMSHIPSADLPGNLTLYWRVLADGANGPSAWSAYGVVKTGPPVLDVPESINILAGKNYSVNNGDFTIKNDGGGALQWAATSQTPDLITVDTPSGLTATQGTVAFTLNVSSLSPGNYVGTIYVDAGVGGNAQVTVNVELVAIMYKIFLPHLFR
ncbi:MAG TPA: hypothetical protein VII93_09945, partial [Anaerolineales bacterium]